MSNRTMGFLTLGLFAFASLIGIGCSSNGTGTQSSIPFTIAGSHGKHHHRVRPGDASCCIKHVFIIIQENRSLNNIFAGFPGANTTFTGQMAPAPFSTAPPTSVPLQAVPLATPLDIDHCWIDAFTAYNSGLMDGFYWEYQGGCGTGSGYAQNNPYAYVKQSDVQPYWDIANSWVLAANFYPTEMGPSFTAHLNLIAGTTETKSSYAVADYPTSQPWGCGNTNKPKLRFLTPTQTPGPYTGPTPCFNQFHTMADTLDGMRPSGTASPIPWRFYAPKPSQIGSIWSAFQAIRNVYYGQDWTTDIVTPTTQILKDIPAGKLDNVGVVWVVPQWKFSDHAGQGSTDQGPSWVANVVNAIGTRDKLWDSSAIVVLWDDWGGWYDPVTPPTPPTQTFRQFGVRTPMLILSPYAKQGQDNGKVSLRKFEPGSVLRFIEESFSLPLLGSLGYQYYNGLGYTDQRADSIGLTMDFTQSPRPFGTPIPVKYSATFFETSTEDAQPPDDE